MDMVLQYSPLVLAEAEDGLAEQEVSLSTACHDVLRRLPGADPTLNLRALRHTAMHSSLRPHLFGPLSDEQLLELIKFLDFWELPQQWLRMALAERGARLHPPRALHTTNTVPLDAYSSEASAWALHQELAPVLDSVAQSWKRVMEQDMDAPRVWRMLQAHPPWDATGCAMHVLCGGRRPELVTTVPRLTRLLAYVGDLEALQWARDVGCAWDGLTCSYAAFGGHLAVLQWLHAHGCAWDEWTCGYAARGGHLAVLQWLHEQGCRLDSWSCDHVAAQGNLAVVQWLHVNGRPLGMTACNLAAKGGHMHVLQWLRERGYLWDEQTCAHAAEGGHIEVLRWLREHGCPWDDRTCTQAAMDGRLELLQWLRANGCPWDERTCTQAAGHGRLVVLQWMHANGCPWDASACSEAACAGNFKVLQWLHASGCPWDEWACHFAAGRGDLPMLQWLRAKGCPWHRERVLLAAAAQRHKAMLQWLQPSTP